MVLVDDCDDRNDGRMSMMVMVDDKYDICISMMVDYDKRNCMSYILMVDDYSDKYDIRMSTIDGDCDG